jgi:hypothetical protein
VPSPTSCEEGRGAIDAASLSCNTVPAIKRVYFSGIDPGVIFASSGEEGLMRPAPFSGVSEFTFVFPGPAVPG